MTALRRTLRSLDSSLPIEIETWTMELDSALLSARVATVALGVLGLLGAMLAITGIFGMVSYVATKRLCELGIRVALGADKRKILGAALGRAFRLLAIGFAPGMILGLLANPRTLLYRLSGNAQRPDTGTDLIVLLLLSRGDGTKHQPVRYLCLLRMR